MILTLLARLLAAKLDAEAARQTPIGGTVHVKGVARGVRILGMRWKIDAILTRES